MSLLFFVTVVEFIAAVVAAAVVAAVVVASICVSTFVANVAHIVVVAAIFGAKAEVIIAVMFYFGNATVGLLLLWLFLTMFFAVVVVL